MAWAEPTRRDRAASTVTDSGERFGDARFRYADGVGVQLLPGLDDTSWVEALRDAAMAMAEFAQRAVQTYLEARPAGTFTVEKGD